MSESQATLPVEFVERLNVLYGQALAAQICETFAQQRVTSFRPNTLRASYSQVAAELSEAGFELEPVEWLQAYILKNASLRELEQHPLYTSGGIYVQGLSSMIPPIVLDPASNDAVLDIAAAPGSKTTQLSALMQNGGMILANDASTVRLYKLQANLERLGVENVKTQRGLGEQVWRNFPEVFDKALADVPCSMEGRFNLAKPKTLSTWSVKKIKELANRQKQLLRSALSATKPGGMVVYSTCTLSPEENEGVVDWILKKLGDSVALEPIELPDTVTTPAVREWQGKIYHPDIQLTKRILPSRKFEGFFIAKFRKKVL